MCETWTCLRTDCMFAIVYRTFQFSVSSLSSLYACTDAPQDALQLIDGACLRVYQATSLSTCLCHRRGMPRHAALRHENSYGWMLHQRKSLLIPNRMSMAMARLTFFV